MITVQLDTRTHTIAQFVADYFLRDYGKPIDYSDFCDGWNVYVGIVAEAGSLLEDAVQSRLQAGEKLAEWYDVLEEATDAFHALLVERGSEPDDAELLTIFTQIVDRHLEK